MKQCNEIESRLKTRNRATLMSKIEHPKDVQILFIDRWSKSNVWWTSILCPWNI